MGDERMQVTTNQIYGQVVPHVHFHLVPAPTFSESSSSSSKTNSKPTKKSTPNPMLLIGHGREELDEEEAEKLSLKIKEGVQEELKGWKEEMKRDEEKSKSKL